MIFLSLTILSLAALGKRKTPSVRYVAVKDGWGFSVFDLQTKLWLERQVQLRVSTQRKLPEPPVTTEQGSLLQCTDFDPGGCGTGNLNPNKFVIKEGYRVWQWKNNINKNDLNGQKSFGISVEQLNADGKKVKEPMELFAFPKIHNQAPNQWSEWEKHSSQRHGDFGWWSQVHNEKTETQTPILFPFEMRWRFLLTDTPGRCVDDETIEF